MDEKHLDITYYLADAIVSDPSILGDTNYLQSIPDRIGIRGKERRKFDRLVAVAVEAAGPLTEFSAEAFRKRLEKSRSPHARHLRSATKWAIINGDMMQRNANRRKSSRSLEGSTAGYSEDSALDTFLG